MSSCVFVAGCCAVLALLRNPFQLLTVTIFITHADGSRGVRFLPQFVCVSVCFPHDISDRTTKLDTEMFHDVSWKSIYLGVKRSRSWVTKQLPAWVFALLWVLTSSSRKCLCRQSIEFERLISTLQSSLCPTVRSALRTATMLIGRIICMPPTLMSCTLFTALNVFTGTINTHTQMRKKQTELYELEKKNYKTHCFYSISVILLLNVCLKCASKHFLFTCLLTYILYANS